MNQRAAMELVSNGLAQAVRGLRKLMEAPDPEEWVDQKRSPLGRRRHCELSRRGQLAGARKVGGTWLVKRRSLDAFIAGQRSGSESDAAEQAEILSYRAKAKKVKR